MPTADAVREALSASVAAAERAHRHSVKRAREHRAQLARERAARNAPRQPVVDPNVEVAEVEDGQ